jgi:cytochrome c oxidase cbb3-type subunit 3
MGSVWRVHGWIFCAGLAWSQGPQAPATPEDLAAGEHFYRTECAYCHGPHGEGGRGATLARPRLPHAPDDATLSEVIENGIPETEMPGHWFAPRETRQLVVYVRTLGRVEPQKIDGDPVRGEKLYAGKGGCARCHTLNGHGGALGPDLTGIGTRRSVPYLKEALLDPEAAVPEGFLQVQLVTRDGQRVTGVRLNEDTFSIQIRDLSGNFRSYFRSELVEVVKQPGKSPMPSYKNAFTPDELNDVIAYLDSLRDTP